MELLNGRRDLHPEPVGSDQRSQLGLLSDNLPDVDRLPLYERVEWGTDCRAFQIQFRILQGAAGGGERSSSFAEMRNPQRQLSPRLGGLEILAQQIPFPLRNDLSSFFLFQIRKGVFDLRFFLFNRVLIVTGIDLQDDVTGLETPTGYQLRALLDHAPVYFRTEDDGLCGYNGAILINANPLSRLPRWNHLNERGLDPDRSAGCFRAGLDQPHGHVRPGPD